MKLTPKGVKMYALELSVSDVTPKDGGTYLVFAKNEVGEHQTTINLNFDGKLIKILQFSIFHNSGSG